MATVTGYVERIKYRNEDNGYSVLSVADGGEEYILVGTFPYISEGERIEATGQMVEHSIYGEQLAVESYEIKAPEDTLAIERYLGSGAIKGIGAALAKRIVKKFKADTFRIMEEEPERLAEVKGVSERMAMEISSQVEEKKRYASGHGVPSAVRDLHEPCGEDLPALRSGNVLCDPGESVPAGG